MKDKFKPIKATKQKRVDERLRTIQNLRGIEIPYFEKRENERKIQNFFKGLWKR